MVFTRNGERYDLHATQEDPDILVFEMTRAIRMISQDLDQTYPGDAKVVLYNVIGDMYDALGKQFENPMSGQFDKYLKYGQERVKERNFYGVPCDDMLSSDDYTSEDDREENR